MHAALRKLMLEKANEARKLEANWVNPNAVSVHAVVEGFIDSKGNICNRKVQATGVPRPKIRLTILDLDGVKERENETRRVKEHPENIEIKGKVSVADVATAFLRGGEDAIKAAKEEVEKEKELLKDMKNEEKKAYRTEKLEKKKGIEPIIWHPVYPGLVIDINIWDPAKIAGMQAGTEISLEGLSFKGSLWLKEPKKGGWGNGSYSVQFSVFWNFSSMSFIKQHRSHTHLYEKIPAFSKVSPYPETFDLKFDLSKEGDENPVIYDLLDQELSRCIRIPLRLSFEQVPDNLKGRGGVVASLLPNDSTDDFKAKKRETDEEREKRAAANGDQDIEAEESEYIFLKSRMSVLPYKKNAEDEFKKGETLVHNVVVQINNNVVMRELGITRERYYTRVMEAISQSLEWEVIGSFQTSSTLGNKFNIMNVPQTSGCAGNIVHKARVASCRFEKFLLERAFHPSATFVKEFYSQYINESIGYLGLRTTNPHVKPNPMLDKCQGDLPKNKTIVPLFCLSEAADDYLAPKNFTICAVTSTWFAEDSKRSEEGMVEQHEILRKIGRLSESEADKCLRNEADAVYPVGENSVILIYSVRNLSGIPRKFSGDEVVHPVLEQNDNVNNVENVSPHRMPPLALMRPPPKIINRDTGALDVGDEE